MTAARETLSFAANKENKVPSMHAPAGQSIEPQLANSRTKSIWPYVQIARVDHWFKNVFMLFGVGMAFFFFPPDSYSTQVWVRILIALAATCLIASSNYVLNELIDAPHDRQHPTKKSRPVPSGLIHPRTAVIEWLLLAAVGLALAALISVYFFVTALAFWCMAILYNCPPIRTKELPYLDVLSESINNPIRLFLGWFAVTDVVFPPLSLTLAYWMAGAFFMTIKRFAEYRYIGDPAKAAAYRKSFGTYSEDSLLVTVLFFTTMCALFGGIFIVRYRAELILFVPFVAGFFAYYFYLGLRQDSPTQNPEKLYREKGFLLYIGICAIVFFVLLVVPMPWLYKIFLIEDGAALWPIP